MEVIGMHQAPPMALDPLDQSYKRIPRRGVRPEAEE
jgi:hypothetical protein